MGTKIILCLKLLENMTYIRGLQICLAQGPQKAGHGSVWSCVWGDLLTVYSHHIHCLVEFGVAAWNSRLNKEQVKQLERIQKSALAIILAEGDLNYENAMSVT